MREDIELHTVYDSGWIYSEVCKGLNPLTYTGIVMPYRNVLYRMSLKTRQTIISLVIVHPKLHVTTNLYIPITGLLLYSPVLTRYQNESQLHQITFRFFQDYIFLIFEWRNFFRSGKEWQMQSSHSDTFIKFVMSKIYRYKQSRKSRGDISPCSFIPRE